jgi:hypothetical protein
LTALTTTKVRRKLHRVAQSSDVLAARQICDE